MQGPGMDIISRGPAAQSPLIFGQAPKFWEKKHVFTMLKFHEWQSGTLRQKFSAR